MDHLRVWNTVKNISFPSAFVNNNRYLLLPHPYIIARFIHPVLNMKIFYRQIFPFTYTRRAFISVLISQRQASLLFYVKVTTIADYMIYSEGTHAPILYLVSIPGSILCRKLLLAMQTILSKTFDRNISDLD